MANFCRQCGAPILDDSIDGLCAGCDFLKKNPDPLTKRKELGGVPFRDMKHMGEDERIKFIVEKLKTMPGKNVAVLVDCGPDHQGKGDRYIEKIRALLPSVKLISRSIIVKDGESLSLRYDP